MNEPGASKTSASQGRGPLANLKVLDLGTMIAGPVACTLTAWGLAYDTLATVNPGLVMLSVSGFGQTGPYAQRAAFDRIALAFSGILHLTGYPDRPPVRPGITMADYQAALFGAYAVMMALYHRDAKGGIGQHIDLGLYESVFRFTDTLVPAYDRLGAIRQRQGNLSAAGAPGDIFETSDGRYLVLTLATDAMFARLCSAMGQPGLAREPRYATHSQRWEHIGELNATVARWVRSMEVAGIEAALQEAGLAYTLTYTIEDIFADPHYAARASIQSVENPRIGSLKMPGVGPRLSATPAQPIQSAPQLAEHNAEIFGEWLGLSDAAQQELRQAAVI